MPRGMKKIAPIAQAAKERSDAYKSGEGFNRALYLSDGETAKGRFCEEGTDIWSLYVHYLPKKLGQQYADQVLCLDQPFTDEAAETYVEGSTPCYGCELENVGRSSRVIINFIRYDEPKLVRDAQGKPIKDPNGNGYKTDGVEPALVVCNFSISIIGRLSFLESQKGPLTRHVCTIYKTGDKNNPYMIDVAEENKLPPQEWEVKLFNKKVSPPKAASSLSPKFKSLPLLSYGDMVRAFGGSVGSGFVAGGGQPQATPENNVYAQAAQNQANQVTGEGHLNLGAFGS
jgi:hypothetical protein